MNIRRSEGRARLAAHSGLLQVRSRARLGEGQRSGGGQARRRAPLAAAAAAFAARLAGLLAVALVVDFPEVDLGVGVAQIVARPIAAATAAACRSRAGR